MKSTRKVQKPRLRSVTPIAEPGQAGQAGPGEDAVAGPGGAEQGRVPGSAHAALFDPGLERGAADVRDRMLEHGASLEFTAIALEAISRSGGLGMYAIDAAARILGQAFPILPSPRRKKSSKTAHLFVFVGPTGAGKTSTLAKLGRRLSEAGKRVVFASMDAAGTSALQRVGSLEADVDRAEIPIVSIRGASDLAKEMRRHSTADIVLLDTPGLSPRDREGLEKVALEVERAGRQRPMDVFLVLPATKSRGAIELVCDAFQCLAPTACVLTKLDETREPLTVLEEIARAQLPIAFLCDGLDTRAHLARPTPDRLADLALRGKYA